MALFKYFKREAKEEKGIHLPAENGPLSQVLPPTIIKEANQAGAKTIKLQGKRNPYLCSVDDTKKAEIAKYASNHGNMAAVRHFSKEFPEPNTLKESTIRGWKAKYLDEMGKRKERGCKDIEVKVLPSAKIGRPLLIGWQYDKEVQEYLVALPEVGAAVNTLVAISAGTAVIKRRNPAMLASAGGSIVLTKDWARYLLQQMGYVKRKATTKAKTTVEDFDAVKSDFLFNIKVVVALEEIPPELIINFDQTGLKYVPVGDWTMTKKGSKSVPISCLGDKRQITAVFAGTFSGMFLPPQLIYKGKTKACLPKVNFPQGWDIMCTPNHWANEESMKRYIKNILVPYVEKTKQEMKLPACTMYNGQFLCTVH